MPSPVCSARLRMRHKPSASWRRSANGRPRAVLRLNASRSWAATLAYTGHSCASSMMMPVDRASRDRKSTRLNSSHGYISYAVFCLKKKTYHALIYAAASQWGPVPCPEVLCVLAALQGRGLVVRLRRVREDFVWPRFGESVCCLHVV